MWFAFVSESPELIERAVKHCLAYHQKQLKGKTGYDMQNSLSDRGMCNVLIQNDDLRKMGVTPKYQNGGEILNLRCVSTVYYPDMD